MGKNKAWAGSSLASMLTAVNAIDLAVVVVPEQHVCRHFVAFGQPDDFTKKLFAYKWELEAEIEELMDGFNRKAQRSIDMPHGSDAELAEEQQKRIEAIQQEADLESAPLVNMYAAIDALIRLELGRQFQGALNPEIKDFVVKSDWTIGWLDHSGIPAEIMQAFGGLFSSLADILDADAPQKGAPGQQRRRRGAHRQHGPEHGHDHDHHDHHDHQPERAGH